MIDPDILTTPTYEAPTPTLYDPETGEIIWEGEEPQSAEEIQEYQKYQRIQAALKYLSDWLVENIIRPAIEGATWLIQWIAAELRYWKYEAIKFLTELTSTTEGLIVVIALTLAASIVIPELAARFASSSIGVFVAKVVEWTKDRLGNILEAVHFVDLLAVHDVLLTLWPEWRGIFTPFQDAISALAEQLGQGSGYIHAWLSVTHSLSLVGTSLLNLPPEIGELRTLEKSREFMEQIDQKFRAYSHDPGLIAADIVEAIYIPYAEEIRDTQTATIDSIRETREYALDLNQSLTALDGDLNTLVAVTLPEFQDQMADNLSGLREGIANVRGWIEGTILPNVDLALSTLQARADRLEAANDEARRKLANPIEIFMATEFQDRGTQLATYEYIARMAARNTNPLETTIAFGIHKAAQAIEDSVIQSPAFRPTPSEIVSPALLGEVPATKPVTPIPQWFQGEE